MVARAGTFRWGYRLLFGLALAMPWLMLGCGSGGAEKPAQVDAEQNKKAQQYLTDYRQQIIDANKAKAAEKKKSP
jgi:hypothetical protein